jgi:hypothetical protein
LKIFQLATGDDDVSPGLRQAARDGLTYAAAAASDDSDLSFQAGINAHSFKGVSGQWSVVERRRRNNN